MSSLSESQSVVVLEALASGRPVVTTRCGGPELMIDQSNGVTAEPGQASSLAGAILDLYSRLGSYDPYRIAADAARLYGHDALTTRLTGIYRGIVRARSRRI